jgi:hypothetical protein
MIKIRPLGIADVHPFWNEKRKGKPVMPQHAEITEDPFPNIVMCAKKNKGKTTASIYIILKHLMTNFTELNVFSGDIKTDANNKNAFQELGENYPNNINVYKNLIDKDGNNLLQEKIAESDDLFNLENKEKYEYPRMIFYFDDLTEDELRCKDMDFLFKSNRHHGILDIMCIHNVKHVSPTVREQTNILILFGGLSFPELDNVYKWVSPLMKKDVFMRVYTNATKKITEYDSVKKKEVVKDKNFLFINLDTKQMRVGLSKEIVVE